ncbi:MAG: transporter [Polyangiales bacterium]
MHSSPHAAGSARRIVVGSAVASIVASIVALPGVAHTAELTEECRGVHSLIAPLPDPCLETIDTDRPHQTDTPHVVAAGHYQLELAVASAALGGKLGAPEGARSPTYLFFENNYKFGLISRVDVQAILAAGAYDSASSTWSTPGPLNLRVKLNLVEESGWIPAMTLVPTLFIPLHDSAPWRGGALVFWGWELPYDFELEMNAGVLWGQSPKPTTALVLATAVTHPIVGALKGFVDVYATGPDVALGTGLLMALGRDVQIDLGTYVGLHGDEPVATPFFGLSVRR